MMIVDAHLDLAYNAIRGRAVEKPAKEQTPDSDGTPTVGLPDLRAGNVDLICATIYCEPCINGGPGYKNAEEACAAGMAQLEWYRQREHDGSMRFLQTRADIEGLTPSPGTPGEGGGEGDFESRTVLEIQNHPHPSPLPRVRGRGSKSTNAILLMEGADPFRTVDDVAFWFGAGLRIVGLAWKQTRYAGGTGAPGPISREGIELVKALDSFKIIHDTSHLAEQSFWQLLEISQGPVIATHSNCRSIVPTDRQLSDDMIRAIADRGGVIGINFFDKFLVPPAEYKKRRATLADVVIHLQAMCDAIGDCKHVGLGTDFDGGFGREDIPEEITTAADLHLLGDVLSAANFSDEDVHGILGNNWINFFKKSLPD